MTPLTGVENIRELSTADQTTITGGSYADSLGLVAGLAFGAGVLVMTPVSAPLLGAALVAGAFLLL